MKMKTMTGIIKTIKQERRAGFSDYAISKKLGVNPAEIGRIMRKKYPGEKVAERLGLPVKCARCHRKLPVKREKKVVDIHNPNPKTYRPWLGEKVNKALFELAAHKNSVALGELSASDYIEKMIAHWWKQEFPDKPLPFECKRYDEDLDFVQSA